MMFPIRKSACPNPSSDQRARRKRDEDLLLIISTVMAVIMLFMGATASMAAPGSDRSVVSVQSEMVYICDSKGATSYHHYKDCKLLANCKAKVETVKEMSARGKGRDRCDACNKRLKAAKK
jgi:hypothetical protein